MTELTAPAPAKINLVLDILGKRPDGYHELRTVLQTLELADRVVLRDSAAPIISVDGPCAAGVPADESNLAWRAMAELATLRGGGVPPKAIYIEKHVPAAAGLGGGASNAATVLRLLQREWPDTPDDMLFEAANRIGSDEAFFLLGGTALAEGRGERVRQLDNLPPHDVVLFVPEATVEAKTAALFRAAGQLPYDSGERSSRFLQRHPGRLTTDELWNSFERVAFDVFPGLGELRAAITKAIGAEVRLAGAGPTLFWIGEAGRGEAIAAAARGLHGCRIITTHTARSQWAR